MTFFDANLQVIVANYGYGAVFVMVLLESSGIPLPGETVLICASVYAGTQGGLDIRFVIGAAACGAIMGDNVGFWMGRRFGRKLLLKHGHHFKIDKRRLALGDYLFARYGGMIVFFGRFIAFLRVYAAILAGINQLRPLVFLFYNAIGGVVWALSFGLGGYLIGQNIYRFVGPLGWGSLAVIALGGFLLWLFWKNHEKSFLADAERALTARAEDLK